MPILEVEIVGEPQGDRAGLAQRLADAAADVLGSAPQGTWVRLRILPTEDYAENGGALPGVAPVFVSVLQRASPPDAERADEVRRLTEAIAGACGRPAANVHVRYEPDAAGRQAFGGKLVWRD